MSELADFDVAAFERFLGALPHEEDGGRSFVKNVAEELAQRGLLLWRVSVALMTKHPEILWRTVQWRDDGEMKVVDQSHARLDDDFYLKSPVALARGKNEAIRVRLMAGALPFPICEDLRAEGATDYFVASLPFSNGEVSYFSVATKSKNGFSDAAIAALEALRPVLARRLELESAYYATRALLDVYLGKNAARRVYAGAFQRGAGELIDAAIWFSDMRDFTAMSDRTTPAEVVETLDATFDAIATAISAHGGEVLKFIGDAVLAIFPFEKDAALACTNALLAAEDAFSALDALNRKRETSGKSPVAIGVALHRGQVMYGNIGARDRLDFTVISSSVNEASRLEALCKKIGTSLALSDAFAKTTQRSDLVDLGAHDLKGVMAPLRVFTLSKMQRA